MDTVNVYGMDLPLIAELSDGYYLVVHKNGPAIGNAHLITVLEPPLNNQDAWIPPGVYAEAIRKYVDWSWPLVQGNVEWPDSSCLPLLDR